MPIPVTLTPVFGSGRKSLRDVASEDERPGRCGELYQVLLLSVSIRRILPAPATANHTQAGGKFRTARNRSRSTQERLIASPHLVEHPFHRVRVPPLRPFRPQPLPRQHLGDLPQAQPLRPQLGDPFHHPDLVGVLDQLPALSPIAQWRSPVRRDAEAVGRAARCDGPRRSGRSSVEDPRKQNPRSPPARR